MFLKKMCLLVLLASGVTLPADPHGRTASHARVLPPAPGTGSGESSLQTVHPSGLGPILTIYSTADLNLKPAVAYSSHHDEYLVAWQTSWPPSGGVIEAARIGSGGGVGSAFPVADQTNHWLDEPALAYSPLQDEYLVVYSDDENHIRATRVRWDGLWKSEEFSVDQVPGYAMLCPAVAYNSQDDEYLVVYSVVTSGGQTTGITAQRVKASDGSLLSYAEVALSEGERRNCPDVAYNPMRNEYLIAYGWHASPDPRPYQIRGKVAASNLDGVTASPEITICCADTRYQPADVAVAAGLGEYLLVFADVSAPAADVLARRVSGTGAPQGPADGFFITTTPHSDKAGQDVACSPGGSYLAAHSLRTGDKTEMDIHGSYVMPHGDATWGGKSIIDNSVQYQGNPTAACAPSGDCLVVWEDNRSPAGGKDDFDIRGRFVWLHRVFLPLILRHSL